jgi:hypothetical protein
MARTTAVSDGVVQMERGMSWKKRLKSVSESVTDHLRLRNDYLVGENRILRHQIDGRVPPTDRERMGLAELGAKLDKKTLEAIATVDFFKGLPPQQGTDADGEICFLAW